MRCSAIVRIKRSAPTIIASPSWIRPLRFAWAGISHWVPFLICLQQYLLSKSLLRVGFRCAANVARSGSPDHGSLDRAAGYSRRDDQCLTRINPAEDDDLVDHVDDDGSDEETAHVLPARAEQLASMT
jgi:hypothetical protein